MKKIIMLIMLVGTTAISLTSCNKDLDWQPTTSENIDYWVQTKLFLYYVDDKDKQFFSINNPTTWPVVSDSVLTTSQIQRDMANTQTTPTTISMASSNSTTKVSGYSYSNAHGFMAFDTQYQLPFLVPSVKVNNTGKSVTYIYITTANGIDTDTLTTDIHYAKDKGETYSEIKDIYYNQALVYTGDGQNAGLIIYK